MVATSHFLSKPQSPRKAAHSRTIHLQAYERQDGLWDLEALIEDLKAEPFTSQASHFDCGVPIHLMALRITINQNMDVLYAEASMQRMPFSTVCPEAGVSVERLVGANLLKSFRKEISKRIPLHERCSHLSELAALLPTLAVQTMMPRRKACEESDSSGPRPLKIGGCLAWREDGPLVLKYHPNWYREPDQ
ncbi:hypothetical protein CR155_02300 [Pollutimonas nitritireducens]|uniref:DUF2889 domain-containing protein n=1 Tax=Pollutimonas nitritireducens TaxID=2045209 RepID=A0A2N4ULJ8_9BURK|nr:DUF2889 domain-containing protein [Pollutimonas nitritireducens]PLC55896.1 hypothetical protein CR155_02300 [Pollutimonas nitritireducens]